MFCENCGTEVKDTEKFCPNCGTAIHNESYQQPMGSPMTSQDISYDIPVSPYSQQQPPVKKAGSKVLWIAVPVVVAVIAVVAVVWINFAYINNFVHRTFSSPEDYYRYVEKNALKESVSIGGEVYSNVVLERLDFYGKEVDGKLAVEIGEKGQEYVDLLEMMYDVDLSWINSLGINAGYSFADEFIGMSMGAAVNGEDILSGKVLMDIGDGKMYLQIPELSETYIAGENFDRGTLRQLERFVEQGEALKDIKKALPDQAEAEDMFLRYINIVLDHAEEVTIDKKTTLEVEDIEQKCAELEVVFDADALKDIYISVLEEMLEDKDLEEYIINVAKIVYPGEDGEDVYEDFVENVEDEIDRLKESSNRSKTKLVMTVYVDGKGEIKGRKIKFSNGPEITELMPEKGKDFGWELSFKYSGSSMSLIGSGQRSGDTISGDFRLKIDGTAYADITAKDVDVETLKRGQLNGRLSVKPSSAIVKMLGASGASLKDMQLDIKAKTDNTSFDYKLTLLYDKDELAELSLSKNTQSASGMKAPEDVVFAEDAQGLAEWAENIDWDNVIDKLEKADFPSEIVDQVKYVTAMLKGGYLGR